MNPKTRKHYEETFKNPKRNPIECVGILLAVHKHGQRLALEEIAFIRDEIEKLSESHQKFSTT
jgi:hypothetical protein